MINKNQKGFTLIELLVVIAIIGLLSTMSVVALNQARQKSRDAKRLADMKQVQTALELYFTDESKYPASVAFGGTSQIASSSRIYMAAVPANPSPRTDGACTESNYVYATNASRSTYDIYYCIGDATGGLISGPHHATPAGL